MTINPTGPIQLRFKRETPPIGMGMIISSNHPGPCENLMNSSKKISFHYSRTRFKNWTWPALKVFKNSSSMFYECKIGQIFKNNCSRKYCSSWSVAWDLTHFVCLCWCFTSQSTIFQSYWDGFLGWANSIKQRISVLLKDTYLDSRFNALPLSHCAPPTVLSW